MAQSHCSDDVIMLLCFSVVPAPAQWHLGGTINCITCYTVTLGPDLIKRAVIYCLRISWKIDGT